MSIQNKVSEKSTRALRDAIARGEVREDHFGWTLSGKYLPRWIQESGLEEEFTIAEAEATLTVDAVKKRTVGCSSVEEIVSIGGRVKGAQNDLRVMVGQWSEVADGILKTAIDAKAKEMKDGLRNARSNDSDRGGSVHKNEAVDNSKVGASGEDRPQAGKPMAVSKGRASGNAGRPKSSKGGAA